MTKLTKNEIVSSTKGKYGGFTILSDVNKIKIIDIITIFDDIDSKKCILHGNWEKPRYAIDDFCTKVTLAELINKNTLADTFSK